MQRETTPSDDPKQDPAYLAAKELEDKALAIIADEQSSSS